MKEGISKYGDNSLLQFFLNYSHLTSAVDKQPDLVVQVPESDLIYGPQSSSPELDGRGGTRAGPC